MTDEEKCNLIIDKLVDRFEPGLPDKEWPMPVHDAMALMCANRSEAWVDASWDKLVQTVDAIRQSELNTSPYRLPSSLDIACATTSSWLMAPAVAEAIDE